MFDTLPAADRLADPFHVAVTANGWVEREEALAAAARVLLNVQRDRGFPTPVEGVVAFWDRPYQTIDPAVPQRLLAGITDPEVARLPSGIGSIEQWVDNVDVLTRPQHRGAAVEAYRSWMDPNAPLCGL